MKMATFFLRDETDRRGSWRLALTNDLSCIDYITPLSNAQCEISCTACVEYYSSINKKYSALSIVMHLLSHEQARTIKKKCICDKKWMLHPSVWNLLLRLVDIAFLLLDRFSYDSIFVKLLLQTGRHGCYIGYDCLYLDRDLLRPCMVLYLRFRQSQYTKHDFLVLKKRLNDRSSLLRGIQLRTLAAFLRACNCACQRKFKSRFACRFMLNLVPCIPLVNDCICLSNVSDVRPSRQSNARLNLGGGSGNSGRRLYDFSVIGDYLASDSSAVNQESVFRYVAHVDDVGLLAYSSAQFVHANIPLSELFKTLPVSHARKIASVHCIPAGSRCSKTELLMHVENHSCLQCSSHLTVFSVETPVSNTIIRKKKLS